MIESQTQQKLLLCVAINRRTFFVKFFIEVGDQKINKKIAAKSISLSGKEKSICSYL